MSTFCVGILKELRFFQLKCTMIQEDVYETDDLPESDQNRVKEENFDSEHVEKTTLDVNAAYNAFKGKTLDSEGIDFSDGVAKRRRGYGAGAFVIELVKGGGGEPETSKQQYTRLQTEIKELSEKLNDTKTAVASENASAKLLDNVTVADVAELQQSLKQLQVEQILGLQATNDLADPHNAVVNKIIEVQEKVKKLEQSKPQQQAKGKGDAHAAATVTYELFCHADRNQNADLVKCAELESRLAALEQMLGNDSEKLAALTTGSKGKTIMSAVDSLGQSLQMLDLNHLELVEARLNVLSQKLNQVKEKSSLEGEDVGKVNEVYEMMKKWDNLCGSLPQIVARMQSLKELHEQSLQFSQSLTYLDGIQQELTKTLELDVSLLNEMKETFAKNIETFKTNFENIDKRLKQLSK